MPQTEDCRHKTENTSDIARYALERIPDEKAVEAMRDSLPKVSSKIKPGIMGSLGKRRDTKSIQAISKLLGDSDIEVAGAAAESLAMIGTPAAARELSKFAKKAPANMKVPVADACLICADQLLADGQKSEALALYNELKSDDQPSQVKAAAMKGIITAATKK
jgi:HEAT repeat protein